MSFRVISLADHVREHVEHLIRTTYWARYEARLPSLPSTLVAAVSTSGAIECAAGLRFSDDNFLSECYLDLPVEIALRLQSGRVVHRRRVVEVCHLVAKRPGHSLSFIADIIDFAESAEVDWAIFTATNSLRAFLERSGLKIAELARGERSRVQNPSDWGSYYEHDPRVLAVHRDTKFAQKRRMPGERPFGALAYA
jgi:hypothetical protein